jgi:hypothetical protein
LFLQKELKQKNLRTNLFEGFFIPFLRGMGVFS